MDEVGGSSRRQLRRLGAEVAIHPIAGAGRHGRRPAARRRVAPRALLIGHMDTVFDPGTVAARPFRTTPGARSAPGVTDMKAGLLAGLYALAALRGCRRGRGRRRRPGCPSDGSSSWPTPTRRSGRRSRPLIREAAATGDGAVLECARANGDIVSSRKGTVDLRLTVSGRAAHAGVEPEKGRSAILEAAHKTIALQALNGRWPGVTCNVGVCGAARARMSWPSRRCWRWTCARRPRPSRRPRRRSAPSPPPPPWPM